MDNYEKAGLAIAAAAVLFAIAFWGSVLYFAYRLVEGLVG